MAQAKSAIPEGMRSVIPVLCIPGAAEAIELFKKAFDAEELSRSNDPATHTEDLTEAEMEVKQKAFFAAMAKRG